MTTHYEVCDRWVQRLLGNTTRKQIRNHNVYVSNGGDTIYSYGSHFPMAIALRDKRGDIALMLVNGDRWSNTTTRHQSDLRSALGSHFRQVIIPFSALEAAGVVKESIELIEATPDRTETIKHVTYVQPEGSIWRTEPIMEYRERTAEQLQAICDKRNADAMQSWEDRHQYARDDWRAAADGLRQTGYWTRWLELDSVRAYPYEFTVDKIDYHQRHAYVQVGTREVLYRSRLDKHHSIKVEQMPDGRTRYSWETTRHWLGESVIRATVRTSGSRRCPTCKGTGMGIGCEVPPEMWAARRWQDHGINVTCWDCRGNQRKPFVANRRVTFLSGFDHQEPRPLYFFCELPKGKVTSVAEAYEALKPATIRLAEQMGRKVKRQGDIFAVPVPAMDKRTLRKQGATFEKRGVLLGTNHVATEVAYLPNGLTLARGTLTHAPDFRQPDHVRKPLGKVWHITLKNTVPVSV